MSISFRRLIGSLFISFAAALIGMAQSTPDRPKSEVEFHATYSVPSGEANFNGGNSGSNIDFSKDFNFQNVWGFRVRYAYRSPDGKHKIQAEYDNTTWDRNTTLSRSITFLGQTYVANLNLDSQFKLRYFRAMYSYRWGTDKIRFGPMADMGVITTRLNITGTTNNGTRTTEGSISKFAATLGYDLDYYPDPRFSIFHNLGAIAFQGEHLFHVEGGLKYYPSRHIGVVGGYRYQRYKVTKDDNFILTRAHGPFIGGLFRFRN